MVWSKIDFVLVKNFPLDTDFACVADTTIATKGGHIPVVSTAAIPHLSVLEIDSDDDEPSDSDPFIDFDKITAQQDIDFQNAASDLISESYSEFFRSSNSNPIEKITSYLSQFIFFSPAFPPHL